MGGLEDDTKGSLSKCCAFDVFVHAAFPQHPGNGVTESSIINNQTQGAFLPNLVNEYSVLNSA